MRIGTQRSDDNRRLTRRQNETSSAGLDREEAMAGMTPRPQRSPGGELPTTPAAGDPGDGFSGDGLAGEPAGEEPGRPLAAMGELAHGDTVELEELRATGTLPAAAPRRHRELGRRAGHLAGDLGRGLAAGLVGTAVMTVGQRIEMKRNGREPSMTPAKAVEKVFGIRPPDERSERRLAELVHYAYGTGWGGLRGLMASAGLGRVSAPLAHFAAISTAAAVMLPALGLAPPPTRWSKQQVISDVVHHAVYATAAGIAFALLDRR